MKPYYLFLITFLFFSGAAAGQETGGRLTDLGPQLSAALIQGSVFVQDGQGRDLVYTVVRGRPAHLLGFDVQANKLLVDLALEQTDGVWDLEVSSDGWLYVPGANGFLFRHRPGSRQVENLGLALPGEKVIWDLAAGRDGEIFGGTYPGCRVFRYHPQSGFTDVGGGPLVATENYVRSLSYQPKTHNLYAGIASHAHLIELNPKTREKKEMLPPAHQDQEAIYHLNLVSGLKGGDRLIGWLTSAKERQTLIYNLNSGRLEQTIGSIDVKSAIKSPKGQLLYYAAAGKLYGVDYRQKSFRPQVLATLGGEAKAVGWARDGRLQILTAQHQLHRYDPKTGQTTTTALPIPAQPIDIQTIGLGPDGRIWTGGYLAGSHAAYDPKTGKTERYPGLDQTEGLAVQGSNIYFGIYPKARLYVYDTRRPWNMSQENPRMIGRIDGQDRPFAVVSHEKTGQVFFGTVPGYGALGGALVAYAPGTAVLKTFEQVMPEQSVVSLVDAGDLLVGGTSIFGGLGIVPRQAEASLFGWDPVAQKKTWELVPVPGAMAITGLVRGPDGNIWGVADGTLFVLDPAKKQVIRRQELYRMPPGRPSHIWRNALLLVHPSGQVYANAQDKLFRIEPETREVTMLQDQVSLLAQDCQGHFYFRRQANLWRYEP